MSTWVYTQTGIRPDLWTVGFYSPDGKWNTDSDYTYQENAAKRVSYLNGSLYYDKIVLALEHIAGKLDNLTADKDDTV